MIKLPFSKRIINYVLIIFQGLILIIAGGAIVSYMYFPIRLYNTGKKDYDIVKSKGVMTHVSKSGMIINSYFLYGYKSNDPYSVSRSVYFKTNKTDTIQVFFSDKIEKGMYVDNMEITLLNVFFAL